MLRVLLSMALLLSGAFAHQIVAKPLGKNKYEIAFWTHEGFEKYDPSQLLSVGAYGSDLKAIKAGIDYHKNALVLTEKTPSIMTAIFDAGYWVETHKGFVKGDRMSAKGIVFSSLHSIKMTKTLFSWNDSMSKPVGQVYEVIPLKNPFTLKVGDSLPILVLENGKPAVDVSLEIANHDELQVKTDSEGKVLIPIKAKGLQIIAASFEKTLFDDPKATTLFIQSSLTFELK